VLLAAQITGRSGAWRSRLGADTRGTGACVRAGQDGRSSAALTGRHLREVNTHFNRSMPQYRAVTTTTKPWSRAIIICKSAFLPCRRNGQSF